MVIIYFRNGQVGRLHDATDVQQRWSHMGNRGHLVILCVDQTGAEVRRFRADDILCYRVD